MKHRGFSFTRTLAFAISSLISSHLPQSRVSSRSLRVGAKNQTRNLLVLISVLSEFHQPDCIRQNRCPSTVCSATGIFDGCLSNPALFRHHHFTATVFSIDDFVEREFGLRSASFFGAFAMATMVMSGSSGRLNSLPTSSISKADHRAGIGNQSCAPTSGFACSDRRWLRRAEPLAAS